MGYRAPSLFRGLQWVLAVQFFLRLPKQTLAYFQVARRFFVRRRARGGVKGHIIGGSLRVRSLFQHSRLSQNFSPTGEKWDGGRSLTLQSLFQAIVPGVGDF